MGLMYFLGVSHLLPTVPECNYRIDIAEQGLTHCGLGMASGDISLGNIGSGNGADVFPGYVSFTAYCS